MQKQPNYETRVRPLKSQGEKRCEIQGGSQEMAVMVGYWQNILVMTIQVNLCCLLQVSLGSALNSPELSLLNFFCYHHSHFLAATLDFTSFFMLGF